MKRIGNGGITPCILNLSTRWRWMVSSTPRPLYPRRRSSRYPLYRRLGEPQSRSACISNFAKVSWKLCAPTGMPQQLLLCSVRVSTQGHNVQGVSCLCSASWRCIICFPHTTQLSLICWLLLLWNPNVHHRHHNSAPINFVLIYMNPVPFVWDFSTKLQEQGASCY
jgi:hypothetical protein